MSSKYCQIIGPFVLMLFFVLLFVSVIINTTLIYDTFGGEFVTTSYTEWQFKAYLKKFNKSYNGTEYKMRLEVFKESLNEIEELNKLHKREKTSFGWTKFSDMTKEELATKQLSYLETKIGCPVKMDCPIKFGKTNYVEHTPYRLTPPPKFDWRDSGVVLPPRDQKQCLACWAFSVVGVMEIMAAHSGKGLTPLSIQELIDCSVYNTGCSGGNARTALDYLCLNDVPVLTDEEYPLTIETINPHCPTNSSYGRKLKSYERKCDVNETEILEWVAYRGPVIVAVNNLPWRNYLGGIIKWSCDSKVLNHVAQVIGYNQENDPPYYILKNSYGTDWGEDGYVKISLNENVCGIRSQAIILEVN